ncbi:MAG: toprim domain-containing protein [Sulfurovum sp.]|nr:toprim domain-containing protein [Sulfurovum sp.]
MTTTQAKELSIISYLVENGREIKKETKLDTWFLSPLHEEKTPSFKVSNSKNIWYDHGAGTGGNILDLVMQLKSCDLSQALQILGQNSFSFSPAPKKNPPPRIDNFEMVEVKKLSNYALLKYLKSRKIDMGIADKYIVEVLFKRQDGNKNLFAIGFKNDKGGYETRNALYKGNIGGKAITTIKGKGNNSVAVFEGFIDFLSVLTKYKMTEITDDIIILNSLSMIKNTIPILEHYETVKYFLDNDKAGREATSELIATVGGTNKSYLYENYKDANDWLCGQG